MSKVRVYEVARQLGMKNKELVALFQSLGFNEVRNHMSAVEQDVVEKVKRKLERKEGEGNVVERRIRKGVVKRRGRARNAPTPSQPGAAPSVPGARASGAGQAAASQPGPAPTAKASSPRASAAGRATPSGAGAAAPAAAPSVPAAKASVPAEAPAPKVAPSAQAPAPKPQAPAAEAKPAEPAAKPEATPAPVAEPKPATEAKPAAEAKPEPKPAPKPAPKPRPEPPPAVGPKLDELPVGKGDKNMEAKTATVTPAEPPPKKRPTSPPKTGIEVWGGRPGVPMPKRPQPRRTTYDPRANAAGGPAGRFPRPGGRPGYRPGYRPQFRNRGHQRKGPVHVSTKQMSDEKKVIKIEGETTVQAMAHSMSMKATELLMKLLGMGVQVNINSSLDVDTAKLIGEELGWAVEDVAIDVDLELAAAQTLMEGDVGESIVRPPIVTVMGHVDHGKTTLLDTIRKTNVVKGEAGGITQHVGAYRVETDKGTVCFLDTPGHEAFTSMRARGASVTDIVILICAADDGVMPQTKEAIAHSKAAKVPIIVAINKCDKPGVDPEKVMRELASEGLQAEDWGGDIIMCKVSALRGDGIDHLLEMVLLQAELLELRAHPDKRATGVVVEALLDRGRGPVARVLVQDGTLNKGDVMLAGSAYGRIRAMVDETGRSVNTAGPATPVEVLGLSNVPDAGDGVYALADMKAAETLAGERKKRAPKTDAQAARMSLEALTNRLQEGEQLELKVIVKADVQGSVEALQQALNKLSTKKVKLSIVHTAVGGITETDVNLAVAAQALILGFNVRPAGKARKFAEHEGIEIRLYSVIYEAIDEVRNAMEGLLPARKVERALGKAEIRMVFRISKLGAIAGCMVTKGIIKRSAYARLRRENKIVWEGMLSSLKRFKDDAKEVREGFECGIGLEGYNDLEEGDIIEVHEFEEVKATLD
jgi:translation initiation factor IF-2